MQYHSRKNLDFESKQKAMARQRTNTAQVQIEVARLRPNFLTPGVSPLYRTSGALAIN